MIRRNISSIDVIPSEFVIKEKDIVSNFKEEQATNSLFYIKDSEKGNYSELQLVMYNSVPYIVHENENKKKVLVPLQYDESKIAFYREIDYFIKDINDSLESVTPTSEDINDDSYGGEF